MGALWRSQEMVLCQLFIQQEAAYECINALGAQGLVQFKDLNEDVNAFQRKYVNEIRRCDEMLRKLHFFEQEVNKADIPIDDTEDKLDIAPNIVDMLALEADFVRLEMELKEISANAQSLRRQEADLKEVREILSRTSHFFDDADPLLAAPTASTALLSARGEERGRLGFVAGVIRSDKIAGFERLLWRATRGNAFLRRETIPQAMPDPATGVPTTKEVFMVFFQGSQLEQRVRKICDGYEASMYPYPESPKERRDMLAEVDARLQDLSAILNQANDHLRQNLSHTAYRLRPWQAQVTKIKAVFNTLNKFNFDDGRRSLLAQCWCPRARLADIRDVLRRGAARSGTGAEPLLNPMGTRERPPTYHLTNKYTQGFQTIVDAYGVASYQEVNPGPFTIVTFPFLFAVMFGDCGHGLLMTLAAAYVVWNETKLARVKNGGEIWDTIFSGRYIILLMGIFSMYTGLIYNDCFSKSLTLFDSGWSLPPYPVNSTATTVELRAYNYVNSSDSDFTHAYQLGLDPMWALAENKLTFTNSFKMKLSVILGIVQMTLGVVLSFFNHRYFKRTLNIFAEFIPQLLFLVCIFGYLVVMIFYKWITPSFPGGNPPSLLLMLINMFLKFGSKPSSDEVIYGDADGNLQTFVQMGLVVVSVICIPWMLLTKPLVLRSRHKRRQQQGYEDLDAPARRNGQPHEEGGDAGHDDGHGHDGEFNFAETMVHQVIHTIEFCLGCISNTASYLRLWALSLAHAQLSEVLWSMVLERGFANWAFMYLVFGAWAVLTICVLLIMEGLSAFLHALRLHWVEFQNKFYEGGGYLFAPFSFDSILSGREEDTGA